MMKLVDEVVATIDALVKKNDNRLRVEVDPSLGSMRADLTKVRQALFNLLSNAEKFTDEGEIRLEVRGESRDGVDRVRMAVSDSGLGIPSDNPSVAWIEVRSTSALACSPGRPVRPRPSRPAAAGPAPG